VLARGRPGGDLDGEGRGAGLLRGDRAEALLPADVPALGPLELDLHAGQGAAGRADHHLDLDLAAGLHGELLTAQLERGAQRQTVLDREARPGERGGVAAGRIGDRGAGVDEGEPGGGDLLGIVGGGRVHVPALGAVGVDRVVAHGRPALAVPLRLGAVPRPEHHVARDQRGEPGRDGIGPRRRVAVGARAQQTLRREGPQPLVEVLGEDVLAAGQQVRLDREHRGLLVVAVVALHGRGVHRDDHVGAGRADHPDHTAEHLRPAPHVVAERGGEGVEEVDGVEVEHVLDPGETDGGALLALADQSQRGPLLEADGVPAALAAGDGDDPGLLVLELVPLAEGGEGPGLVVGVGADVQDVQVDGAVGEGALHRREAAEVEGGGAGGEAQHGRALQEAPTGQAARCGAGAVSGAVVGRGGAGGIGGAADGGGGDGGGGDGGGGGGMRHGS
jgi:hypothetical protein